MSKSHVRELSRVYAAILKDAARAYPTLETEFERDLTRLHAAVDARGIAVYLLDLPAIGKHLDRCLANGEYKVSGLPLTKRFSGTVVIPKFLRGLYLLVFDGSGSLKENYDVQAIFFLRQILFAAKKASVPCSSAKVATEVVAFYEVDRNLPEPEWFWKDSTFSLDSVRETYHGFSKSDLYRARVDAAPAGYRERLSRLLARLDIVSSLVACSLGAYTPADWKFRHGPGAISESTGPSNKYCWENWSDHLENAFPIADYGFHSLSSWAHDSHRLECLGSREPRARMVAVPKSYSKPRLIAAEPKAHQWCQQNLWHYFAQRADDCWIRNFIRFRDQSHNQRLCSLGASSGALATVDLSAASDRVTCHAVGQLFRSNPSLLLSLKACRTHLIEQQLTHDAPELIELRKFSTMGNACTFPVESLMFLSICLSSVLEARQRPLRYEEVLNLAGEVAVFGDDLIVPTESRELLFAALEILDFKVNLDKSFWTGRFRESCGVDSYAGVDVTPAYWKAPNSGGPESVAMTVETSNNFYKKYMLESARVIASTVPSDCPMVPMDSGVLGLETRTRRLLNDLPSRWNSDLQRAEVRIMSLTGRQSRTQIEDDSAFLQYFTEAPDPHIMWSSGIPQRPCLKLRRRWVPTESLGAQP